MKIRIIKRPLGEAPDAVRDAWIGLLLPVSPQIPRAEELRIFGVNSGPPGWLTRCYRRLTGRGPKRRGYAIDAVAALHLLEAAHPEAAAWWRTNAPYLTQPGRCLVFDEDCCTTGD
jgi:hypothetical protein